VTPVATPAYRQFAFSACALAALALFQGQALAQVTSANRDVLLPNTGLWSSSGVTLGGTTFVNLGLQGVGRIAASTLDPVTGETFGSISDLQVSSFTNNGNGSFTGTFEFLPDRGYNAGAIFSNYAARINTVNFTFTPYTGAAPTTAQNQIAMTVVGSTRFTVDHDNNSATAPIFTTGLLPQATPGTLFGTAVPTVAGSVTQSDGSFANRLTVDAEGLAFDRRAGRAGSGWVGDEYGAYVYHFNAAKQIDGVLTLPPALVPHGPAGSINFAQDPPTSGRRINQGMEGIALSPDGNKLFTLLQSATIQDSGSGNQGRSNTRLVVYDVSGSNTPSDPVAQYVIQLPRVDSTGSPSNGTTVDRTAAQSAVVALNDHQLLILSRDGNGRGAAGSPVFKSVLLADLNGATNIDGLYDAEGAQTAPGGVLRPTITPISWTEALNMIGKLGPGATDIELAKFGLNINNAPGDINTISEKWEALALVPVGDPAAPNDYFLFVGNDNDFQSATGQYMDANGVLQAYNAGLENDTVMLAYRVQVVPEPGTWALMAAGLLAVGSLARRRR
jgi:hypothetical protein